MSEHSERQQDASGEHDPQAALTEPIGTGSGAKTGPGTASTTSTRTTSDADGATVRPRRGIRVRTVVFGLALLAISASVLVTLLTTAEIDATAVTFVVLIGAGAALLAGGLAAAVREARGGPGS